MISSVQHSNPSSRIKTYYPSSSKMLPHSQSKMEYVWFPLLHPKITESEFGYLTAMGSPEADYANWQTDRLRRIERGTPKSDDHIIVDSVLRCPIAITFGVAYTTQMSGWSNEVQEARLNMLSSREQKVVVSTVQAPRDFLFTNTLELREFVAERLGQVQSSSGTEITFLTDSNSNDVSSPSQLTAGQTPDSLAEELVTVQIRGSREDVNEARIQLLILLDQCAGFDCDRFDSVKLLQQYATAGANFTKIFEIMRKTSTKIYFTSPLRVHSKLPSNALPGWENRIEKSDNALFITGLRANIEYAKSLLLEAANARIISSNVTLSPRKLEWILLTQSEYLHSVMCRCGVFISFPPLGSPNNFTTIYGTDLSLVFKAVRDIAALACEYHEIFLTIYPIPAHGTASSTYSSNGYTMPNFSNLSINISKNRNGPQTVSAGAGPASMITTSPNVECEESQNTLCNLEMLLGELGQISESTGAEVCYSENVIAIYGPHSVVSPALTSIINCNYFQRFRNNLAVETEVRVEIAQKHEEFLKGKHCGKIKKLVQGSQVRYTFEESLTESNVVIRVHSPVRYEAISAYHNLSLELPIEMSLYIPESEHHKMIGEKGRNSQRLSTKYHAFLRFSSKAEQAEIGGYFKLSHNVFALTPSKYSNGFENLVGDLVQLYRQVCTVSAITVSLSGPPGQNTQNSNLATCGSSTDSDTSGNTITISNGPNTRFARGNTRFSALGSHLATTPTHSSNPNMFDVGPGHTSANDVEVSEGSSSNHSSNNSSTTIATMPPMKTAQTLCEVMFPHRFLHFLLPHVNEIENKHAVRVKSGNCEFGLDLIQLFGTHQAIHEAISEIAARCAPQSICIETVISPNFIEARFAAGVDIIVDHLMEKFNVLLAVSLAPAKRTVMFRLTTAPEYAESLAPCCMMTIEYFSDQIMLPTFEGEATPAKSEKGVTNISTRSPGSLATSLSSSVGSPSKESTGENGSDSNSLSSPEGKLILTENSPKSVDSKSNNTNAVSAAESSFQYFDARVYSGTLPNLNTMSPPSKLRNNIPTPEGGELENDASISTPSAKSRAMESPESNGLSRKTTSDNAEGSTQNRYSVSKRSGSLSVRDLWNAIQKTPDCTRISHTFTGISNLDTYDLISPATAAEISHFNSSIMTVGAKSTSNTVAENNASFLLSIVPFDTAASKSDISPAETTTTSTSVLASKKPVWLSIVKPGNNDEELLGKDNEIFENCLEALPTGILSSAGVTMTTTGTNTEVGDGTSGSALDDVEIRRGVPKKRRMSLLSPTPASRTSPPARLQPPRKVNLENVGEKDDTLETLQIRELTSNMGRVSLAQEKVQATES